MFVTLGLKSKQFSGGLKKGRSDVGKFSSGVGGSLAKMAGPIAIAAAGIFSISKAIGSIKEQFSEVDRISKLSDELNISTESLVSWGHAAGLAGSSSQDVEKGLRKFVKVLGELDAGISDTAKNFTALGLNVNQLIEAGPEKAFTMVAESISKIDDPMRRAAIATSLFGKNGQKMMVMMMGGAGGLAAARKEADALGITFDRLEGSKIEAANDAMLRLKTSFTGISRKAAIQLAPMIEFAAENFTEIMSDVIVWMKDLAGWGKTIGTIFAIAWDISPIVIMIRAIKGLVSLLSGDLAGAAKNLDFFQTTNKFRGFMEKVENMEMPDVSSPMTRGLAHAKRFTDEIMKQNALLDKRQRMQNGGKRAQLMHTLTTARGPMTSAGSANSVRDVKDRFDELERQAKASALVTTIKQMNAGLREQVATWGMSSRQLEIYRKKLAGATSDQLRQAKTLDRQLTAMEKMAAAQESAKRLTESLETPAEKMKREIGILFAARAHGGLDSDTFQRGLGRISAAGPAIASPAALERGSSAEFSLRNRATQQSTADKLRRQQVDELVAIHQAADDAAAAARANHYAEATL